MKARYRVQRKWGSQVWALGSVLVSGLRRSFLIPLRDLASACRKSPFLGVALALGLFIPFLLSLFFFLNQPTGYSRTQEIVVRRGMTAGEIGRLLARTGLIRSRTFFALTAEVLGLDRQLEAGRYHLNGSASTLSILRSLRSGQAITRDVTVPEGLIRKEIAGIFRRSLGLDSLKFLGLTEDAPLVERLGIDAPDMEGYLFPETYNFDVETEERRVIERMVGEFKRVFSNVLKERAAELGLSLHEAVTLASIIEGEAKVKEERPIISAVFHNRLRLGWRLEADPTVLYALDYPNKKKLRYRDLRIPSPYNTYLHRGLPPGPICNPGKASIMAALYPAEVDYRYFVARGDGTHIFTRTNREHTNAKRQIKREERRRRLGGR